MLPSLGGKYRQGGTAVGNQASSYQSMNRYRNNKYGSQQKRGGYELPDYLKSRVKVSNSNQNQNKPGSQHSNQNNNDPMNDRSLSYNRRLQNAIHQQNNKLYPGGYNSIDRSRSGHGGNRLGSKGGGAGGRQKIGFNHQSQPSLNINKKPNYFSSYGQRNHIPNKYGSNQGRIGSGGAINRGNINSNSINIAPQMSGGEYGGLTNTSVDENYKSPDALKLLKRGK